MSPDGLRRYSGAVIALPSFAASGAVRERRPSRGVVALPPVARERGRGRAGEAGGV